MRESQSRSCPAPKAAQYHIPLTCKDIIQPVARTDIVGFSKLAQNLERSISCRREDFGGGTKKSVGVHMAGLLAAVAAPLAIVHLIKSQFSFTTMQSSYYYATCST